LTFLNELLIGEGCTPLLGHEYNFTVVVLLFRLLLGTSLMLIGTAIRGAASGRLGSGSQIWGNNWTT